MEQSKEYQALLNAATEIFNTMQHQQPLTKEMFNTYNVTLMKFQAVTPVKVNTFCGECGKQEVYVSSKDDVKLVECKGCGDAYYTF